SSQARGIAPNVWSLAVNDTSIYVGSDGGISLSTDNGTSWLLRDSCLSMNTPVHALAVSGTQVFAGTAGYGICLSTNDGTSWIPINSGLGTAANYVWSFLVNETTIFAGTNNGVFKAELSTMTG